MYACRHCGSTRMFMALDGGILVKVLEDHEDVEGLEDIDELLCTDCNRWFENPARGADVHRELTGELVAVTGMKGKGTVKVVSTGIRFPFHYDSYEEELATLLRDTDPDVVAGLREFTSMPDHALGLRVKEHGNQDTWLYRLERRRLWRAVEKSRR